MAQINRSELKLFAGWRKIKKRIKKLGKKLAKDFAGETVTVIINMDGATRFAERLMVYLSNLEMVTVYVKFQSYTGTTSRGEVDINRDLDMDLTGQHVIIIEDIVDSGRTAKKLIATIRAKNPASITFVTLVDKPHHHKEVELDVDNFYFCFQYTGDLWLIGFGFDIEKRYRNWKEIRLIPKQE